MNYWQKYILCGFLISLVGAFFDNDDAIGEVLLRAFISIIFWPVNLVIGLYILTNTLGKRYFRGE